MRAPYAKKSHRIDQLNETIGQRLSAIIREYLELPTGALVTVTTVRVSKDLRHARIGFSIYPAKTSSYVFSLLRRNIKHLQFILHQGMTLKSSPELTFVLDKRENTAAELEAVLDRIKEKKAMVGMPGIEPGTS
ncbi:MAG: ribosome-binding factor A [Candidatus Jacksonbacteria bacterium]|nr:ribosome-binding factor A [Candidatus Jacksonbacteria bacterium]